MANLSLITAKEVAKKVKALNHFEKLIKRIDANGKAIVVLNCTGASIVVHKGDPTYLKFKAEHASLAAEIASYHVADATPLERMSVVTAKV